MAVGAAATEEVPSKRQTLVAKMLHVESQTWLAAWLVGCSVGLLRLQCHISIVAAVVALALRYVGVSFKFRCRMEDGQ